MVRVRIAPSPTGFAHVGTAYTALFNYAFATKNKGKFVLRLEDTDVKRNVKGAEEAIYEGLSWLGLSWDEGPDKGGKFAPYRQSERLKTYQEWAEKLVKEKKAYTDEGAVRFGNTGKDMGWNDLVRGKISFPGEEVTDFVILKSDGFPTYNFGVVVDDILMEITHVIRGEEHISNTPRQLALYQAFGVKPPEFAHLPTLRNTERKKLSKRRDPVDLRIFREKGYLPEALVNFLCLLGWSHPQGKEVFDLNEFVGLFDLGRVRSAGPIFNLEKLDWLNGEYIRAKPVKELAPLIKKISKHKLTDLSAERILELVRDRMKTLSEFDGLSEFFFDEPELKKELWDDKKTSLEHLKEAYKVIEKLECTKEAFDTGLQNLVRENGWKMGDFFMSLRAAVCGKRNTPPITETMVTLGKKESLKRVKKAISFLDKY